MRRRSTYDRFPVVPLSPSAAECAVGWKEIAARLRRRSAGMERCVMAVECYPGVFVEQIRDALERELTPSRSLDAGDCFRAPADIDRLLARDLTDDQVFGRMNGIQVDDFLDRSRLEAARAEIRSHRAGIVLVIGTGASLLAPEADLLVYADMARWEIQARQRSGEIGNLGAENRKDRPASKYKRAFFVDWRAADRLKKSLLPRIDFLLDTNDRSRPKLISGEALRDFLARTVRRPFRVVPFFDPGPWGGQWMRRMFDLPDEPPNYAWCFDCVPEENSLLLGFGEERVEIPSIDLIFTHPAELLGEAVHARFGAEFPIRFDLLDTMDGGNLSLQVHPFTEYIQDRFGMHYTQDESYYLLDAGPEAVVFLGLKEGVDGERMLSDLGGAQEEPDAPFPDGEYIRRWPARKHDHFLIPAGTIHCSGRDSMVLEISATPYIFTFKLWDWGRVGLDGRPRPIHLEHGAANIQMTRTTEWVRKNLVNRVEPVTCGERWREERTGLHEREFIETRRHWFTGSVPHDTDGGVNVLNLVEGSEAVVESPTGAFEPFVVHYAETFIIPAAVGPYTITPTPAAQGRECATIKAFVRTNP